MKNQVEFKVWGRFALFTDPLTRIGGEKCSYHIPTYEALKGIIKSVYWKPTFIWIIDSVRIMKPIRTQAKGIKPRVFNDSKNELAIYTYLAEVEYQVLAHFEWNMHRPDLASDRCDGKHYEIAKRMIVRGGRRDVCLGARECQAYVEPCSFGAEPGHYDGAGQLAFGLMFHGFDYPDEIGEHKLYTRFWHPTMVDGVVKFIRPEQCKIRNYVREMEPEPPATVGYKEEGLL